jgi:hypothetical protein
MERKGMKVPCQKIHKIAPTVKALIKLKGDTIDYENGMFSLFEDIELELIEDNGISRYLNIISTSWKREDVEAYCG